MTGLRERQKAKRHSHILAAAGALFKRDGFAVTSIEGIAAEAEVAAGTVYNYFQSKGDLLLALVALDGEEVRERGKLMIANPPADPIIAVRKLLEFYVDHSLVHLSKELWRNAMATALTQAKSPFGRGYAALDRKLADQVGDLIAVLQERGSVSADIDADVAGDVLFEMVNSLFQTFVAHDDMPMARLKSELRKQIGCVFAGLAARQAATAPRRRH
ncbi:TetR/AcrR family transcriptional regulator [Dongia deserti]|uniref:TetR/AcrR family transcriptional regulator n=1 Tax=Dongia deserti TaxID=2268030 RepID=UPI000E65CCEC|nr:TetR/AcrR family transcriptional regulator [Dongia deserti]